MPPPGKFRSAALDASGLNGTNCPIVKVSQPIDRRILNRKSNRCRLYSRKENFDVEVGSKRRDKLLA